MQLPAMIAGAAFQHDEVRVAVVRADPGDHAEGLVDAVRQPPGSCAWVVPSELVGDPRVVAQRVGRKHPGHRGLRGAGALHRPPRPRPARSGCCSTRSAQAVSSRALSAGGVCRQTVLYTVRARVIISSSSPAPTSCTSAITSPVAGFSTGSRLSPRRPPLRQRRCNPAGCESCLPWCALSRSICDVDPPLSYG